MTAFLPYISYILLSKDIIHDDVKISEVLKLCVKENIIKSEWEEL